MAVEAGLSPLVFSELYSRLVADEGLASELDDRLNVINLTRDWLTEAANQYESKWISLRDSDELDDEQHALSQDHTLLASWLMAPLLFRSLSTDLDTELRSSVTQRVFTEGKQAPQLLPAAFRPAIMNWQLGTVLGEVDPGLPMSLAYLPRDPDVQAAYHGLVKHVLHLQDVDEPWPEMLGTSTLWRGTGIAEGVKPEAKDAQAAVALLLTESRRTLPEYQAERLARHFTPITHQRNALSHVAELAGKPRFHQLTDVADDWQKIQQTVFGVTHFVCSLAATELTNESSRMVYDSFWDNLRNEIEVY